MDREYIEFFEGEALVIIIEQMTPDEWVASTVFRERPYEARGDTAKSAKTALLALPIFHPSATPPASTHRPTHPVRR